MNKRLGEILVDEGYIDAEDLEEVLSEQDKGKRYTKEELKEVKEDYNQDQKMNFLIDMMDDNANEIERIRGKLYNGWSETIMKNSIFRRGSMWFIGAVIAAALGWGVTVL